MSTELIFMPKKITNRLSGIPIILAGLLILVLNVELGVLECNRLDSMQITCELTSSNLLGKESQIIAAGQLKGAKVQTKRRNHRVLLLTEGKAIPLIKSYTIGIQGKRNQANQINDFIHNSEPKSLTIKQDSRWFGYSFGLIFILSGIWMLLGSD